MSDVREWTVSGHATWINRFAVTRALVHDSLAFNDYCHHRTKDAPKGFTLTRQLLELDVILGYDPETGAEVRGDVVEQTFAEVPA